jgi:hypothetical protein
MPYKYTITTTNKEKIFSLYKVDPTVPKCFYDPTELVTELCIERDESSLIGYATKIRLIDAPVLVRFTEAIERILVAWANIEAKSLPKCSNCNTILEKPLIVDPNSIVIKLVCSKECRLDLLGH